MIQKIPRYISSVLYYIYSFNNISKRLTDLNTLISYTQQQPLGIAYFYKGFVLEKLEDFSNAPYLIPDGFNVL